jgi:hypothetical protein
MAKTKPRTFSFTREERWFVLEHNSFISFYNNLVKSYIETVVVPRLNIKLAKDERLNITPEAKGLEVVKLPKAEASPKVEVAKK